jgi:hypothetical protein
MCNHGGWRVGPMQATRVDAPFHAPDAEALNRIRDKAHYSSPQAGLPSLDVMSAP